MRTIYDEHGLRQPIWVQIDRDRDGSLHVVEVHGGYSREGHQFNEYDKGLVLVILVVEDMKGQVEALESKINARDREITNTLELILQWKRDYQPTLDEAKKYFEDKVGRIGKHD